MRKRGRIDTNQDEIADALRCVHALVWHLSPMGSGMADLLVQFRGTLYLLEVKARRGRLTPAQVEVHQRWQIQVVRSVDEALKVIGAQR